MIRKTIIPHKRFLNLEIPQKYLNKKIEISVFSKNEIEEEKVITHKKLSDFCGFLKDQDAKIMRDAVGKECRQVDLNEWQNFS